MKCLEGLAATLGEARAVRALLMHIIGEDAFTDILKHLQKSQFSAVKGQEYVVGRLPTCEICMFYILLWKYATTFGLARSPGLVVHYTGIHYMRHRRVSYYYLLCTRV